MNCIIASASRAARAGVAAVLVSACLAGTAARAGILDTPHNLIGAADRVGPGDPSIAVCAFCHTPHGGEQPLPLWQRRIGESQRAFRTYDSFGRSSLPDVAETGSVSLSCMSCHDGAQALNVAVSVPAGEVGARGAASMLSRSGAPAAFDTSISHPVGVPYGAWAGRPPVPSGGVPAALSAGTLDADAQQALGFRPPSSAVIDGVTVWWLETGAAGRQRDDVHLYSRAGAGDEAVPYVECASCHDPHVERPNFLRTADPERGLCSSCHAM